MVNKKWILVLCALCTAFLLTGCMSANYPEATNTPTPITTLDPTLPLDPAITAAPNADNPVDTVIGAVRFDWALLTGTIQSQIEQISEIQTCAIVVSDNRAVVGVTFTPEYRGELTDRIAKMIADKIKTADTIVTDVRVTTDPARISTVKDLAAKAIGGMTTSAAEFNSLYNQIG